MGTSASWTPERKERQREAIQQWKPWEKSTGPRTDEGKATSSRNAMKMGDDKALRQFARAFKKVVNLIAEATGVHPINGLPVKPRKRARSLRAQIALDDRLKAACSATTRLQNAWASSFGAAPLEVSDWDARWRTADGSDDPELDGFIFIENEDGSGGRVVCLDVDEGRTLDGHDPPAINSDLS